MQRPNRWVRAFAHAALALAGAAAAWAASPVGEAWTADPEEQFLLDVNIRQLRPIYGVTIPVIVRLGNLEAKAGLANVRKVTDGGKPAISLDIVRSGSRSTFGEIRVFKAGVEKPIAMAAGIAVYTEIGQRSVTIPIDPAQAANAAGQVTVQYVEPTDTGPVTIAETSAVLR